MFTAKDIEARGRAQPFTPFRIVTSAGQMFDVRHPELIMIGRREVMIGAAGPDAPTHYEQLNRLAIMHITALQDLPAPVPPGGGNGPQ
jgi:hypothetical protein